MIKPDIHVYADLEELSHAVAVRFVETANRQIAEVGAFFVALSGGSTPRRLYELLGSSYSNRVDWKKLQLFQVDERSVPPDHSSSNFRMIREALLKPAHVPAENIHRISGELDPAEAARNYESDLESAIPARCGGVPRFDFIVLGIGSDGHVASLFSGSPALGEKARWVVAGGPGPEGLKRVTLTLPVLNAASSIIFLVSGSEKSETLARVLEAPVAADPLPVQGVVPANGSAAWYVDRAAASRLRTPTQRKS